MKRQQRGWLGMLAAAGLGLALAAGAARAADFYVDLNWTGTEAGTQTQPFRTISNAVAAANTADYSAPNPRRHTVRIAGGTYKDVANGGLEDYSEPANPNYPTAVTGGGYKLGDQIYGTYDRKRVVDIYGGYAGWDGDGTAASDFDWTEGSRVPRSTIIDLQGANSRAFVNNHGTHASTGSIFDGLTIVNGSIGSSGGGAIIGYNPAVGTYQWFTFVNNCLFSNNVSSGGYGGALFCSGSLSDYVRNSEFVSNQTAYGGAVFTTHFGQFSNTVFRGNQATVGGAVFIQEQPAANVIIACTFENNQASQNAGAFYGRHPQVRPYQIKASVFRGNSAPSGAAIGGTPGLYGQGSAAVYLENCLLVGNSGGGYAVHVEGANYAGSVDMLHCTVVSNANGGVRGRFTGGDGVTLRVRNSIVANNGGYGIYKQDVGESDSMANNDVWNNTSGNYFNATPDANSISSDPSFTGGGDYRLAKGSPCVDAGANLGIATDLDGVGRPTRFGYDMGCYEEWQIPIIANRAPVADATSVVARATFTYEGTGIVTHAWFVLDTTDQGTNSLSGWWQVADSGAQTQGVIFGQLFTGLTAATTYRYRCVSSNSYDLFWGPVATFTTPAAGGATRVWTGFGGNALASNTNNWQEGLAPAAGDYVLLDASPSNMTWDAGVGGLPDTVSRWTQTENYRGTVTFNV